MNTILWWAGALAVLGCLCFFTGCTTTGQPMRHDPKTHAKQDAWFIQGESKDPSGSATPFSCSFVEFDGRGDYIDFKQHTGAWRKVKELGSREKLLLVFYAHGWKNNSQSGDVAEFNEFLGRLAASPAVKNFGYRVHGIYLGWRGNLYHPYVDKENPEGAYQRTANQFGEPIINAKHHRKFGWTAFVRENLSYWSRRRAAEHKVSSVPLARTVFTCATLAKSLDAQRPRAAGASELLHSSRVMVMGHSFGALLLERALNATCLDPLTDQWMWFESKPEAEQKILLANQSAAAPRLTQNPLPLDFVLFINSAAPAIYAKTMRDFLAAHQSALRRAGSPAADAPVFMSITSSADQATRRLHPIANVFAPIAPSLQRTYTDLIKFPRGKANVHQSAFYNRTVGHQPLLVDHWVVDAGPAPAGPVGTPAIINENLDYFADTPLEFFAQPSGGHTNTHAWKFSLQPPNSEEAEWAAQFGEIHPARSSYWFVRCGADLIRGHNDIWSDSAMELYAALYRLVEWTRLPENHPKASRIFNDYWNSAKKPAAEPGNPAGPSPTDE